mmetsp:Transcript_22448/g.57229  ORF Transcript_22448/g.57229 Transcript_22448/m.57229 type:complete len:107 (-) Transcript_22448:749-1069(-)
MPHHDESPPCSPRASDQGRLRRAMADLHQETGMTPDELDFGDRAQFHMRLLRRQEQERLQRSAEIARCVKEEYLFEPPHPDVALLRHGGPMFREAMAEALSLGMRP